METGLIKELNKYYAELTRRSQIQTWRFREIEQYSKIKLKRRKATEGRWYYCECRNDGTYKYLGDDSNETVKRIKEARFLSKALRVNENNMKLAETILSGIQQSDYEAVNKMLPKMYSNSNVSVSISKNDKITSWKERAKAYKERFDVYMPQELKIRADDGNYVRSKSEAMIYNYLLSMGVTFVYELPLKIGGKTVVPDFTLLSEIDCETEILIEHQGMMGNASYRSRFAEKLYRYYEGGFVQGINIFFTFDSPDGGLDRTPVEDIVRNKILP